MTRVFESKIHGFIFVAGTLTGFRSLEYGNSYSIDAGNIYSRSSFLIDAAFRK